MKKLLLACSLFALTMVAARAASVDDVLDMAKKGAPEDKIIAAVEGTQGEIVIGADDVLRLREAKISDKVIMAMLRHTGGDKAATAPAKPGQPLPPAPVVEKTPPPVQPAEPRREAPPPAVVRDGPVPADGRLTIDNLDDRPWAYMYEPAIQTIWIAPAGGNGGLVRAHGSLTLSMRAGTYKVRFLNSQDEGVPLTIYGGEKSAINLTHVNVDGSDSLYATVFERGERKGSAKVAALDKLPAPEVVVQREIVEGPTYYSDPPVYYSSPGYYYGSPYYYGPSYGLGLSFRFGSGGHYHGGGSYYHGGGYYGGGSGYRSGGSRR